MAATCGPRLKRSQARVRAERAHRHGDNAESEGRKQNEAQNFMRCRGAPKGNAK